jgi:ferredoxin
MGEPFHTLERVLLNCRHRDSQKVIESVHPGITIPAQFRQETQAMADAANKYSQNITGAYYVDDQCIDCDLCRETAPANFTRDDDGGHSYVYKQPETDDERAQCEEAMAGCPVEAIGSDGE